MVKGEESASASVVIPFYRDGDTIMRAVQSALDQDDGRTQVIVVIDDGSLDARDMLERIGDARLRVLVNERNLGAPASRNRGLAEVRTPYVLFLDADDYLTGTLIAPLVRKMEEAKAQVGFGPSAQWSPSRGLSRPRVPGFRDHADIFLRWFGHGQFVNTASVTWSTDFLRGIGGWDETLRRNQDGELALRAILLGARFVTSAEGLGVWCRDPARGGITRRIDNLDSLFAVVDKFLAMRSDVVPDDVRLRACALSLYGVAHLAFNRGRDDIGREALERSRRLGFKGHSGTPLHVAASSVLGLPLKQKLTRYLRGRLSL